MSKEESNAQQSANTEDDDEPDEWWVLLFSPKAEAFANRLIEGTSGFSALDAQVSSMLIQDRYRKERICLGDSNC